MTEQKALGKWLIATYRESTASGKTQVWDIRAAGERGASSGSSVGDLLGEVRWFGRWRQYAFFPVSDTVWNSDCLDEVNRFVAYCTVEHRNARLGAS